MKNIWTIDLTTHTLQPRKASQLKPGDLVIPPEGREIQKVIATGKKMCSRGNLGQASLAFEGDTQIYTYTQGEGPFAFDFLIVRERTSTQDRCDPTQER